MSATLEVEKLAYELWEKDGRPHGRDEEFYFTAERMLSGQGSATAVAEAPKKRTTRATTSAKPRAPRTTKQA